METMNVASSIPTQKRGRGRRVLGLVVAMLLVITGGVYAWNHIGLQRPMNDVLTEDPRNDGISVKVRHEHYVSPSTIVFDVRSVQGRSRADLFRVLLQFAAKMKDEHFDSVLLAYGGDAKFSIDGDYFNQLGREYGAQNPIYTMRTFPSHVKLLDGSDAYGQWQGGIFAVANKQLEEFGDFFDRWLSE